MISGRFGSVSAAALFAAGLGAGSARADEGMWTLDNLPTAQMEKRYGFSPTAAWIDHVMHASAKLPLGCSASFVSPDGLVMTNHHCANGCLADLSTGQADLMQDGYLTTSGSEPRCPGMELDQLDRITDVTGPMDDATKGRNGAEFIQAQHTAQAALEKQCAAGDPAHTRCDVVTLYEGGRYALYRYKRFDDVRLVFAPDQNIAFFGGDPDNFNFPRYDIDVTFLRAYEGGKPAQTAYFAFDPNGPKAGELVFTSGNPYNTQRETTAAQLRLLHDFELPIAFGVQDGMDGVLWQYSRQGAEQKRNADDVLFGVENTLKVYTGWGQSLGSPEVLAKKEAEQKSLLDWIDTDPARRQEYGDPFSAIAATLPAERSLYARFTMLEGTRRALGFQSRNFAIARGLVRAADELAKPDADRLPPYREANLPALKATLFSNAPIHPGLDETMLAFSLTKLRQVLGADDPSVRTALGTESPEQKARELVEGTKVADVAFRKTLWDGGRKAVDASTDPMIRFAALVDPDSRHVRKAWEDTVEAPQRQQFTLIAKARFAREGTSIYPDATFTERLSFGKVAGWNEPDGKPIAPFTDFAGLFRHATGSDPFRLTDAWVRSEKSIDPHTPLDFSTTNDIIGGNSGSPVIDRDARAVGLAFDGNIHSIAGDFVYDDTDNRMVAVDTAAILAALRDVYHDGKLVDELTAKTN